MDDMRGVLDAVRSERAAVFGHSEGGAMCALFAATYPERTTALVMAGSAARTSWAPDYPLGATDEEIEELERSILDGWGAELIRSLLEQLAPSIVDDEELVQAHARAAARAASPAAAAALIRMSAMIDVRHVLPAIRVPTLVFHRSDEVLAEASRYATTFAPGIRSPTAKAGPGEVLTSSTVRDLVAGSGLEFEDRGAHQLKGVPGEWRLFAVRDS
jgi:pimeloyl-ACP methyl ester carboxylesterase